MAYEDHLKWLLIEANTVEKYRQEGEQKGRQEGREEGRQEGIRIGEEKGKLEGKMEIAKDMLKDGFQLDKVILFTGLYKSDIQSII
ncbi:protein of unknown function [Cardinium endosymbiont cEper1 of Encarsia pergandiella]|nr:hypothetical protein [Cardinium endosymbiont of Encarsia pergandiella]CCM10589.1 protein of unknown function [Cardinium endosymbiont cEper1 of Encarsia pergandiella]